MKNIISPSYSRDPFFIYGTTETKIFESKCDKCGSKIELLIDEIIHDSYSWKQKYNDDEINQLKEYYNIGYIGKSHDGGSPAIIKYECRNCNSLYYLYFGVKEPANSVYVITLQAITLIE
jgi:hypothetical protein